MEAESLRVEPAGPGRADVDLLDFLGPGPLHAGAWRTGAGEARLVLTRTIDRAPGLTRRRDRYTLQGRLLDATRFAADESRVIEYARADGGPFASMAPLVVPRRPLADGHPRLVYAGPAELIWPDRRERTCVLGLAAADSLQWFAEGVGEIWIGRAGAPGRWIVGWLGPQGPRFGGLPAAFAAAWRGLRP